MMGKTYEGFVATLSILILRVGKQFGCLNLVVKVCSKGFLKLTGSFNYPQASSKNYRRKLDCIRKWKFQTYTEDIKYISNVKVKNMRFCMQLTFREVGAFLQYLCLEKHLQSSYGCGSVDRDRIQPQTFRWILLSR